MPIQPLVFLFNLVTGFATAVARNFDVFTVFRVIKRGFLLTVFLTSLMAPIIFFIDSIKAINDIFDILFAGISSDIKSSDTGCFWFVFDNLGLNVTFESFINFVTNLFTAWIFFHIEVLWIKMSLLIWSARLAVFR